MEKIRQILVPTDFSDCAAHAFVQALDLARRHGAVVHLLNHMGFLEIGSWSLLLLTPEQRVLHQTAEEITGDLLARAIDQQNTEGVPVVPAVEKGTSVASDILAYAKKQDIDLIVMGTHGRQGVQHLLLSSVAEKIVHMAACPVLVVHANGSPDPEAVRRILVPLDFSPGSPPALDWAKALASGYSADLVLLHVIEGFPAADVYKFAYSIEVDLLTQVEAHARKEMATLAAQLTGPDRAVEEYLERGYPPRHIITYAKEHDIDLIVMASHGHAGLKHLLLGSVAEKAVRAAPCPVLVVKTGVGKPSRAVLNGVARL